MKNTMTVSALLISISTPAWSSGATNLENYKKNIEIYDDKAYKKRHRDFPWQLKCTSVDRRIFTGCLEARFFDPSTRVYFDGGSDHDYSL